MGIGSFFKGMFKGKDQAPAQKGKSPAQNAKAPAPDAGQDAALEQALQQSFARVYSVELHFREAPRLNAALLQAELAPLVGTVESSSPEDGHMFHFFYRDHAQQLNPNLTGLCYQFCLMRAGEERTPDLSDERHAKALQQSHGWPHAAETLAACRYSILCTDLMSSSFEPPLRLELFQKSVFALVRLLQPAAIYAPWCEQFVDPETYLDNVPGSPNYSPLYGAMNVRMFRDAQDMDVFVMDTLGLAALGLPDLQVHYRDLDVNDVARWLYNVGYYIFQHGDVIEDGHTVQGLRPDEKWRCQHELSIVQPTRVVLDVNPGPQFAAGPRA